MHATVYFRKIERGDALEQDEKIPNCIGVNTCSRRRKQDGKKFLWFVENIGLIHRLHHESHEKLVSGISCNKGNSVIKIQKSLLGTLTVTITIRFINYFSELNTQEKHRGYKFTNQKFYKI